MVNMCRQVRTLSFAVAGKWHPNTRTELARYLATWLRLMRWGCGLMLACPQVPWPTASLTLRPIRPSVLGVCSVRFSYHIFSPSQQLVAVATSSS